MTKPGAIAAIIAFIIGLNFAIPNQANIGYMFVDALANASPTESFLKFVPMFKIIFILLGIMIVLGDIIYIYEQLKKGNF